MGDTDSKTATEAAAADRAPVDAAASAASADAPAPVPADAGETFDPIAYINTPRWQQVKPGLERIADLLDRLDRPQDGLRFVHVAGTNGKGSVCSYIAQVLQKAGYRTGLFTSPYIERFEERIRVNGQDIAPDALRDIALAVREHAEAMAEHPTEFELMCAVAMLHFARSACDIVVLEVGLGGRWDATNVIGAPDACVICRLGLDHTALLGDTLTQIAAEKAGIVKHGCSVVSWPQEPEAMREIERVCREQDAALQVTDFSQLHVAPLRFGPEDADAANTAHAATGAHVAKSPDAAAPFRRFAYRSSSFSTRLLGSYQPGNAALAIDALLALREHGWSIPDEALHAGIATATWPGRFEVCGIEPLFIVDGGHNPQGAQVMADTLRELLPDEKPVFLIGILADKDYPAMLREVVPLGSAFVCVTPDNPRALAADDLARTIEKLAKDEGADRSISGQSAEAALAMPSPHIESAPSLVAGVERARQLAGPSGTVCAFGSLYSIAAIKSALRTFQQ